MSDEFDTPYSLLNAYQNGGMVGWIDSPRDRALFLESQPKAVYSEPNIAGSGEKKFAALWQYPKALDKLSFTERQTTGDCTSHASRNARDISRAVEIMVKGEPESFVVRGATEPTYGARGHAGQGMSPAKAAMFEKEVGFLIRKKYDVVDLSAYNSDIGARWGSRGVPEDVQALCRQHKVGVIRQLRSMADVRDALANGYAIASGQYAAWDAKPDGNHLHRRVSPGWNHAMATVGMDFSRQFWSMDVLFIQNSWGAWNQAPKEWPKYLPPWVPGMIVSTAEDWNVCLESEDCYAYGSIDGFPPQKLPDLGSIGLLQA